MVAERTCIRCRYLCKTAPKQRFWLCKFWSGLMPPTPHAFRRFGYDYVLTHCHMQPTARACPFFYERPDEFPELSAHELERYRELTDKKLNETLSRYVADLYAELSRMTVKQLRTYANQNRVPLAGASGKESIIAEMVAQLAHRKYAELTKAAW